MIPMTIHKVAATPWKVDEDGKNLSRTVVLQTTFGERRQIFSITRADRPDGRKALGVLIVTNFKVLELGNDGSNAGEGSWLAVVLKHNEQKLTNFACQCSDIDAGSLLTVAEPEHLEPLMGGLLSGLSLTFELYGPDGLVDTVYLPGSDEFPDIFTKFWTK